MLADWIPTSAVLLLSTYSDRSLSPVNVMIQLVSQVLPPSSENDCSKRDELEVMPVKPLRTKIVLPLNSSRSMKTPCPLLNSPIMGVVMSPSRLFAQFKLHWCDWGLYRRRPTPSICPAGPSTSSSNKLARPFHTRRTREVPSYSTQFVEPVNGFLRRDTWVFQLPKLKSKSCCRFSSLAVWCKVVCPSDSRVTVATQLGSQVLPPSSEKDCSKWYEFGVMS